MPCCAGAADSNLGNSNSSGGGLRPAAIVGAMWEVPQVSKADAKEKFPFRFGVEALQSFITATACLA